MLRKAKELASNPPKIHFLGFGRNYEITAEEVTAARQYVRDYWPKLIQSNPKDNESLVGLPRPYLVPSYAEGHEFDYDELFYWDSYFTAQGLLDAEHRELLLGILEDFFYLLKRFKIIPNSSRIYQTSRSQPPFLTTFIFDLYAAYNPGQKWFRSAIDLAKVEYETVWMGTRKPNARQVYQGLSRYYDFNYLHSIAETESGWDMTPRFNRKALNYLPVDLNALLYKYEADFARAARLLDDPREMAQWEQAARERKHTINKLMWDQTRGLFYDFDYTREKRGNVSSLAAYFPMWAGMVDGRQAQALVKALKRFEQKGGLATTDSLPLGQYVPGSMPMQWAYPNGWAPLHFIVVKALQRYGYNQDARRIAMKWLRTNLVWFQTHHEFLEKYNVVAPGKPPAKGIYPSQTGFGWTNAIFERFCQEFIDGRAPLGMGPMV
ncbi:MAG TPA: trehalase family glycosidase [Candidatus Saccharimonadales bacterium]|nr:trehalase family glycosidase [Candidatus Saccharimonadales bacterium]